MENNLSGISAVLARHLLPSLQMLKEIIKQCPENIWNQSMGNLSPIWEHTYHSLESIDYWFSDLNAGSYPSKVFDKDISSEFKNKKGIFISKEDLFKYYEIIEYKINKFFHLIESGELLKSSDLNKEFTYMDIVLVTVRHIQFHVGYCSCLLATQGFKDIAWIGYAE